MVRLFAREGEINDTSVAALFARTVCGTGRGRVAVWGIGSALSRMSAFMALSRSKYICQCARYGCRRSTKVVQAQTLIRTVSVRFTKRTWSGAV
jgi:hypothetical protein